MPAIAVRQNMIALLKLLAGWCPTIGMLAALIVSFQITEKYRAWILAFIKRHDPEWKYFRRPWSAAGPAGNMFKLCDPLGELSESVHAEWKVLIRAFWIETAKYVIAILAVTVALQQSLNFLSNSLSTLN